MSTECAKCLCWIDHDNTGHATDCEDYARFRLEYLRSQIRAERISYGEISELQGMADEIDRGDVELLEWAGVPEFYEDSDAAKEL